MNYTNEFLLEIGRKARRNRLRFWDNNEISIRLSKFQGKPEAGLWFRTKGCSYDHKGGCLMCDYSTGQSTKAQDMIRYVENGLQQITSPCNQLLVSPSGSMLDQNEVPKEALKGILYALSKSSHKLFSFETRADTITEEKIDICHKYLGDRFYRLFLGLECVNDWVRKYCVNKQLGNDEFIKSVEVLKRKNVKIAANILISIPFLSEKENIALAIEAVKWAINLGVDECFLFPVHVKKTTPLNFLHEKNIFSPSSLWSLIEIIKQLGPQYYNRIRLSWYTSYGAYNVLASPDTCPKCHDEVISHLDQFAEYQLASEIKYLSMMKCSCKTDWENRMSSSGNDKTVVQRVIDGYEILANEFLGLDWWRENSNKLCAETSNEADKYLYSGIGGGIFE